MNIHAGGIVWHKNYLYVADTSNGFRVFDMNKIIEVSVVDNVIGRQANGTYAAYNYRYVLPQVGKYFSCGTCCNTFSSVSLDKSTNPYSLLSGFYSADRIDGTVYRWNLNEQGRLQTTQNVVRPVEGIYMGISHMQGILSHQGVYFAAQSGSGNDHYRFGALNQGISNIVVANGIEDLYYIPESDRLWSLTERAGSRVVFATHMQDVLNQCR